MSESEESCEYESYPSFTLQEGVDFGHHEEIVEVITEKLRGQSVNNIDELLVSGYNEQEPLSTSVFYAMTIAEYREMVKRRQTFTPFHFGVLATVDSKGRKHGNIAIGVYDPDFYERTPDSYGFTHIEGKDIETAKLAVFSIVQRDDIKKVVLEVGPETRPVLPALIATEKFPKEILYIALDDGSNNTVNNPIVDRAIASIRPTLQTLAAAALSGSKSAAILSQAERLPLINNSVDEAVLCNVIGQNVFEGTFDRIVPVLHELRRVIKSSGVLTIYEAITPPRLSPMVDVLEEVGFTPDVVERSKLLFIRPRTDALRSLDKRYGKRPVDAWKSDISLGLTRSGFLGRRYYIQARPNNNQHTEN